MGAIFVLVESNVIAVASTSNAVSAFIFVVVPLRLIVDDALILLVVEFALIVVPSISTVVASKSTVTALTLKLISESMLKLPSVVRLTVEPYISVCIPSIRLSIVLPYLSVTAPLIELSNLSPYVSVTASL